jgi:hypothetical protein
MEQQQHREQQLFMHLPACLFRAAPSIQPVTNSLVLPHCGSMSNCIAARGCSAKLLGVKRLIRVTVGMTMLCRDRQLEVSRRLLSRLQAEKGALEV